MAKNYPLLCVHSSAAHRLNFTACLRVAASAKAGKDAEAQSVVVGLKNNTHGKEND